MELNWKVGVGDGFRSARLGPPLEREVATGCFVVPSVHGKPTFSLGLIPRPSGRGPGSGIVRRDREVELAKRGCFAASPRLIGSPRRACPWERTMLGSAPMTFGPEISSDQSTTETSLRRRDVD